MPVLEKIREFLRDEVYSRSLPKSALREAMNYVRNNWPELQMRRQLLSAIGNAHKAIQVRRPSG
ncbi:MAG: hypothetical protein AB7O38_20130 [Pirellulaceae bacterium]